MLHKNSKIPSARVLLSEMSPLDDEVVREGVEELAAETESAAEDLYQHPRLHATEALNKHDSTAQHVQNAEQNHSKDDGNASAWMGGKTQRYLVRSRSTGKATPPERVGCSSRTHVAW